MAYYLSPYYLPLSHTTLLPAELTYHHYFTILVLLLLTKHTLLHT